MSGKHTRRTQKRRQSAFRISAILTGFVLVGLLGYGIYQAVIYYYISKINYEPEEGIYATTEILIDPITDIPDPLDPASSGSSEVPPITTDISNEEPFGRGTDLWEIRNTKDVTNILLIGSDTRKPGAYSNSDSMMLISINTASKKIVACSLLRDMWCEIEGKKPNKLNAAYSYGGPKLLMNTVKKNFNIDVENYISIDFFSFVDVVDIMGGVDLELSVAEIKVLNMYLIEINQLLNEPSGSGNLPLKAGVYHLNGKQTLAYARNRYTGTDFARTRRQRTILMKLAEKAKKLNLFELNELFGKVLPKVSTNMPKSEMQSIVSRLPTYLSYQMEMTSLPQKDTYTDEYRRKMEVLIVDFDKNNHYLYNLIYH